jgi:dTMP kinase
VPIWTDLKTALRGDSAKRRRMAGGGVFIAFEGGEGSGKSTQIRLLAAALRDAGIDVVETQEPGATKVGRRIRDLLLHDDEALVPRAEALLFAADRANHVAKVIQPALDRGDVVLTDRYVDSSMAYQGAGRELTFDEVRRLSGWATCGLTPDLTVLLDIPAAATRAGPRAHRVDGRAPLRRQVGTRVAGVPRTGADGVSRTGGSRPRTLSAT